VTRPPPGPPVVHSHRYETITVQTGDVLCTVNGLPGSLAGALWTGVGALLPGQVDHCALFVGPEGRCVEAGTQGVIAFDMPGPAWDATPLYEVRGVLDRLYGVADPLAGRDLSVEREWQIRRGVADFCLDAAARHAGYNANFFALDGEARFYCSQLIYRAYREYGIDLNTDAGVPGGPVLGRIVFPEEIWNACVHHPSPWWPAPPSS
jgi:hypothetical protein